MIELNSINRVYVFTGATDFRKGMHGLLKLVTSHFDQDSIYNMMFLFYNKDKTCVKILQRDSTGLWMYQKRLDKGKFMFPDTNTNVMISPDELKIILTGLDFLRILEQNDEKATMRDKKIDYF